MWWEPREETISADEGQQGGLREALISEVRLSRWLWFCQAGSGVPGCMQAPCMVQSKCFLNIFWMDFLGALYLRMTLIPTFIARIRERFTQNILVNWWLLTVLDNFSLHINNKPDTKITWEIGICWPSKITGNEIQWMQLHFLNMSWYAHFQLYIIANNIEKANNELWLTEHFNCFSERLMVPPKMHY